MKPDERIKRLKEKLELINIQRAAYADEVRLLNKRDPINTNQTRRNRKQRRSARRLTEEQQRKVEELRKRVAAARQPGIPKDVEIRVN